MRRNQERRTVIVPAKRSPAPARSRQCERRPSSSCSRRVRDGWRDRLRQSGSKAGALCQSACRRETTRAPAGRESTVKAPRPTAAAGGGSARAAVGAAGRARGGVGRASVAVINCAGRSRVITILRSCAAYPSRAMRMRCGPSVKSRTAVGVRPASRSSTNTLAPAGVERTFNRPAAHALVGAGASAGAAGGWRRRPGGRRCGRAVVGERVSARASDTGGGFGASGSVLSVDSRAGTARRGRRGRPPPQGCSRTPTA